MKSSAENHLDRVVYSSATRSAAPSRKIQLKNNDASDAQPSVKPSRQTVERASDLEDDSYYLEAKAEAGAKDELNILLLFQSAGLRRLCLWMEERIQCLPLFKDLFFIVRPTTTWNRVVAARHGVVFIFVYYLLPMMLATALFEGHGLMSFGRQQVAEVMNNRFTLPKVFVYEAGSAVITLILICLAAVFIKSFANACHARNNIRQCLTVMLYSVGPMFLVQWFNVFPNMYYWLTWLIGAFLTMGALYHGLPRIMQPDPPSAMGLYIGSALTVFLLLLGGRILTGYYLTGNFKSLEIWLTKAAGEIM